MNLTEFAVSNKQNSENVQGAKIPWDEPGFSQRMLENHLAQEHDWASRRNELISRQAAWLAKQLQNPSYILDLGCGPGFYTQKLAALGHHCVGVDFSPASIEYARKQATESGLAIEYALCDIRTYTSAQKFDCIIMTFGEFNVFTHQDANAILKNCAEMLRNGGLFILEAHTFEAVHAVGSAPATWQRHASGLFSENPHLCLQENSWSVEGSSTLSRYFIMDAATATVRQYASFMQAYWLEKYQEMLHAAKLPVVKVLDDEEWPAGSDFRGKLQTFVCRKDLTDNVAD
ncbi:class I SAM-dependent methyltransferase [Desulfovibrio cuneatus]|uniref:class I SAM-dependent methyltransferase n=1 Tax=Desulfovibrio cuneatus TaxID=159728 RepID=UPI0004005791|nr:class I SAM-dependent methyltransferase [Desulfovibrio cuneatus]